MAFFVCGVKFNVQCLAAAVETIETSTFIDDGVEELKKLLREEVRLAASQKLLLSKFHVVDCRFFLQLQFSKVKADIESAHEPLDTYGNYRYASMLYFIIMSRVLVDS